MCAYDDDCSQVHVPVLPDRHHAARPNRNRRFLAELVYMVIPAERECKKEYYKFRQSTWHTQRHPLLLLSALFVSFASPDEQRVSNGHLRSAEQIFLVVVVAGSR
jgi:hypothetical protein